MEEIFDSIDIMSDEQLNLLKRYVDNSITLRNSQNRLLVLDKLSFDIQLKDILDRMC